MSINFKVVQPSGIIDRNKSSALHQEINQLIEEKTKIILVDLQEVTFMDSSSLGMLVLCFQRMRENGGKLYLASLNEEMIMLFNLIGINKVFQVFPNRQVFEEKLKNIK